MVMKWKVFTYSQKGTDKVHSQGLWELVIKDDRDDTRSTSIYFVQKSTFKKGKYEELTKEWGWAFLQMNTQYFWFSNLWKIPAQIAYKYVYT